MIRDTQSGLIVDKYRNVLTGSKDCGARRKHTVKPLGFIRAGGSRRAAISSACIVEAAVSVWRFVCHATVHPNKCTEYPDVDLSWGSLPSAQLALHVCINLAFSGETCSTAIHTAPVR